MDNSHFFSEKLNCIHPPERTVWALDSCLIRNARLQQCRTSSELLWIIILHFGRGYWLMCSCSYLWRPHQYGNWSNSSVHPCWSYIWCCHCPSMYAMEPDVGIHLPDFMHFELFYWKCGNNMIKEAATKLFYTNFDLIKSQLHISIKLSPLTW